MVQKNHGLCSIRNCNSQASRFRQFTSLAYEKAQKKGTYEAYTYLRIGQQLCHSHYMSIVEPYHKQKSENSFFLESDENITHRNIIYSYKNYKNYSHKNNKIKVAFLIYRLSGEFYNDLHINQIRMVGKSGIRL